MERVAAEKGIGAERDDTSGKAGASHSSRGSLPSEE